MIDVDTAFTKWYFVYVSLCNKGAKKMRFELFSTFVWNFKQEEFLEKKIRNYYECGDNL